MLVLSDELYLRFSELLLIRCGLYYPEHKRRDLAYGLEAVLKTLDYPGPAELLAAALADGAVWDAIVQQFTIGETYFFRNAPQFAALRKHVLPDIISRRAQSRNLRIWSVACATGEEPYSLAMLLADLLPDRADWYVSLLATDINQAFLARARDGLYGEWSFRETPPATRSRFFLPEGRRWRIRPDIRRAVTFAPLNLVEDDYPSLASNTTAMDLILCRNVMIYFDEMTMRRVVDRLYRALAPGGWLIVGHSEPHIDIFRRFEAHNFPNTVLYRKPLAAPLFAMAQADPPAAPRPPQRAPFSPPPADSAPASASPRHSASSRSPLASPQSPAVPSPPDPWPPIAALLERGEKAAAETRIADLLRAAPNHQLALLAQARLCADRGEEAPARALAGRLIASDPLNIEAHYLLGQIDEQAGLADAALAAYRRTVFLDAGFAAGLLGMARCWQAIGRAADATRTYRALLARLATLAPDTVIAGLDGMTVGELVILATAQAKRMAAAAPDPH